MGVSEQPRTISSPAAAAALVRAAAAPLAGPVTCVLALGGGGRLRAVLVLAGAGPGTAARLLEPVLATADDGRVAAVVVAPRIDPLPGPGRPVPAVAGCLAPCDRAGVELAEVLLVGASRWRSVWDRAAGPGGARGAGT